MTKQIMSRRLAPPASRRALDRPEETSCAQSKNKHGSRFLVQQTRNPSDVRENSMDSEARSHALERKNKQRIKKTRTTEKEKHQTSWSPRTPFSLKNTFKFEKQRACVHKKDTKTLRRSGTDKLLHAESQYAQKALPHRVHNLGGRHQRRSFTWKIQPQNIERQSVYLTLVNRLDLNLTGNQLKDDHDVIFVVDMELAQEESFEFFQTLNGCVICPNTVPPERCKRREIYKTKPRRTQRPTLQLRAHLGH